MLKQSLLMLTLFASNIAFTQAVHNSIQIGVGRSWHGTGDMGGFAVEFGFEKGITKRFSLLNSLATTIHYKKDAGLNSYRPGASPQDRLMHFTTAGIQLNALAQFAPLAVYNHQLRLMGGGLLRFQSSSLPNVYGYYQDERNFPEPFYVLYGYDKPNSLSAGYSFGIGYQVALSKKYQAGFKALFQNDTHADAITQLSLTLGRMTSKCR